MLFPVRADPVVQLKAYLMSGHGTHCIEVHLSKTVLSEKDIVPWFKGFEGARIELTDHVRSRSKPAACARASAPWWWRRTSTSGSRRETGTR